MHRSMVALINYISQDRPDLGYCSTELSRTMANPRVGDEICLKRVIRYLARYPVAAISYLWQSSSTGLLAYSDADWGGGPRTRRSTSGGFILSGNHLLAFWSRTQQCVALSSCEAEVNALIKAGTEGLGVRIMMQQCGEDLPLELRTDASAAQGLCARQGAGRVKHLSVRQLWAQEREAAGDFQIKKLPREENVSDMMTHHWSEADGRKFLPVISMRRLETETALKPRRRVER